MYGKKGFLKTSQNSQQSTYAAGSFLIKLQGQTETLWKKRLQCMCFPVNLVEFLRTC